MKGLSKGRYSETFAGEDADSHAMCDIPGDITRLQANFT